MMTDDSIESLDEENNHTYHTSSQNKQPNEENFTTAVCHVNNLVVLQNKRNQEENSETEESEPEKSSYNQFVQRSDNNKIVESRVYGNLHKMFIKHCSNFEKKLSLQEKEVYYDIIDKYWNTLKRNKNLIKDIHTQTSSMNIKTEYERMDIDEGFRKEKRKKRKRLLRFQLVRKMVRRQKWLHGKSPRNILNMVNCISPKKKHMKSKGSERLYKDLNVLNKRRRNSVLKGKKRRREYVREHIRRRYHRIVLRKRNYNEERYCGR